jgi:hypothetical protein
VGNVAASSAQSKQVGTGVEHSGAGLEGGETRDGGRKTAAQGDSDMSTAVKDGGAEKRLVWGRAEVSWGVWAVRGGRGVNGGVPGCRRRHWWWG